MTFGEVFQDSGQPAKSPSVAPGPQHFFPVLRLPGFGTRVPIEKARIGVCLLYTSAAADDLL